MPKAFCYFLLTENESHEVYYNLSKGPTCPKAFSLFFTAFRVQKFPAFPDFWSKLLRGCLFLWFETSLVKFKHTSGLNL